MEKNLWLRRWYHVFPSEVFRPNRRKTTWANNSVFQKGSGIKIFLCSKGVTLLSIFSVSRYRQTL